MTRRLAAIMFTDLVGYTALMGKDSQAALDLIHVSKGLQKPLVAKFGGTWLKEMGDGVLVSFDSAQDAVQCAIDIQKSARAKLAGKLRIGIHLGDVVVQENDVYGDGVNIASRIESQADPGGIYVSGSIAKAIRGQSDIKMLDLGEFHLKNVDYPVQVFAIGGVGLPSPLKSQDSNRVRYLSNPVRALVALGCLLLMFVGYQYFSSQETPELNSDHQSQISAPDQGISIAVLPFLNMSGDEAMEPFCDGMTYAVISRLTKIEGIARVISRTSMMAYKNTLKSIPEIARELNVTHLLEAGFQKADDNIKINLQLIDGKSDDHFWSDDYTGKWGNIFEIQAEVAENVAKNLKVEVTQRELDIISQKPTESGLAYDLYLQAEYQRLKSDKYSSLNAVRLYEEALELDSAFFDAYIGAGRTWGTGGLSWGIFDRKQAWEQCKKYYEAARRIDPNDTELLDSYHSYLFYYEWDFPRVEAHSQSIRRENPEVTGIDTDYLIKTGRSERALVEIENDIDSDPSRGILYFFKAQILFFLNRNEETLNILRDKDPLYGNHWWYTREISKLYFYLGEHEKFSENTLKVLNVYPDRPPVINWLGAVRFLQDNDHVATEKYFEELRLQYSNFSSGSPAWFIAMYYCVLKDYNKAVEWLQKSYDRHEVEMTWLREEPLLRPLRGHPTYKELYKKVGFDKVAPILPPMAFDF